MFILNVWILFSLVLICLSEDFTSKKFCEEFDGNKALCNSKTVSNSLVDCNFISLNGTTNENVCVPDNCGQYVNDSQGCQNEANCIWFNDQNTQVNIERCYPS